MDKIQLLQERKMKIVDAGKEIRADIAALIDEESFVELSAFSFSKNEFYGENAEGEGVVTGYATIDGYPYYIVAQNFKAFDGGISKAYQSKTGIAGYTLIYNSHSILLAEHRPYDGNRITPNVSVAVAMDKRVNIADTDQGEELRLRIEELGCLLEAYRNGDILEK